MRMRKSGKCKGVICLITAIIAVLGAITYKVTKKAKETTYDADVEDLEPLPERKMSFYEKYIKRALDIVCAWAAIIAFGWLYAIVALLVRIKHGSPVLFTQDRPGMVNPKTGKETVFKMFKFRSMTDERDEDGNLLPDEVRLTKFGKLLRASSLDELPEAFNILNGTMSVIGPRPQLVRDMTFMTKEQRMRHTAKPGLSGLAQISGRNDILWEDKLSADQEYIQDVSLKEDASIVLKTVEKAFIKQEGITDGDMATAEDFGDYLLRSGQVDEEEYDEKQDVARRIVGRRK